MKRGILITSFMTGAALLLILSGTVSAGIEPVPWQPQINILHAIELNMAAIAKRAGSLLESPASFEGIMGYLDAMANQTSVLDARLADTLSALPPPSSTNPFDGQDEVLFALDGIMTDAVAYINAVNKMAERMGVEPTPWKVAVMSMMDQIRAYACPAGTMCPS